MPHKETRLHQRRGLPGTVSPSSSPAKAAGGLGVAGVSPLASSPVGSAVPGVAGGMPPSHLPRDAQRTEALMGRHPPSNRRGVGGGGGVRAPSTSTPTTTTAAAANASPSSLHLLHQQQRRRSSARLEPLTHMTQRVDDTEDITAAAGRDVEAAPAPAAASLLPQRAPQPTAPKGLSYLRPMRARQFAHAGKAGGTPTPPSSPLKTLDAGLAVGVTEEASPAPTAVLSLHQPSPPPPPSSSPSPPEPEQQPSYRKQADKQADDPLCTPEAFYRGIDLMNAALRATRGSGRRRGGRGGGAGATGRMVHALAYSSGGGRNMEEEDDDDTGEGTGLTFQALVPSSSPSLSETGAARQRVLRSVELLPLWLISDGLSLLVVDFNGSQKHRNYQFISSFLPPPPQETGDGAEDGGVFWLPWGRLSEEAGKSDTKLKSPPPGDSALTIPLADCLAAIPARPRGAGCGDTRAAPLLPDPVRGLKHVTLDYAAGPAVIFFPHPSQAAREALEDLAQAYLPAFLQGAYPGGVPVVGAWAADALFARPLPAESRAGGLAALYPALHAAEQTAHARASHGLLRLPLSMWQALARQRTKHITAARGTATRAATVATTTTTTTTSSSSSNTAASAAALGSCPRGRFDGQGRRLGRSHEGRDEEEAASHNDAERRLAWMAAAQEGNAPSQESSGEPRISRVTEAAPSPSHSRELLYMGTLTGSGDVVRTCRAPLPPPPSTTAGDRMGRSCPCQRVAVLTPAGRFLLERQADSGIPAQQQQLLLRHTTVRDVKTALLNSALGRKLGLVAGGFTLVYGPGTSPPSDEAVIDTPAATMRLVRGRYTS